MYFDKDSILYEERGQLFQFICLMNNKLNIGTAFTCVNFLQSRHLIKNPGNNQIQTYLLVSCTPAIPLWGKYSLKVECFLNLGKGKMFVVKLPVEAYGMSHLHFITFTWLYSFWKHLTKHKIIPKKWHYVFYHRKINLINKNAKSVDTYSSNHCTHYIIIIIHALH